MIFKIFSSSKNTFEGIHHDEETVLIIRRHWFAPTMMVISLILAAIVPLIAILILGALYGFLGFGGIVTLAYTIYLLSIWFGIFYTLMLYSLDVWIVTNLRIIDSRQHGFFSRTVSELPLPKVQDITVEVEGVIETFLNFGDIKVQSAGTEERFIFLEIPNPAQVKDRILQLSNQSLSPHP
jgi:hypothetical protein